ncbi:MAG TPA: recombinase RecT [Acetobacteraceae bacterium]|jgi:recombination protein RecT|nr:recombinase RecT [Acetobacteraceae bacterium]
MNETSNVPAPTRATTIRLADCKTLAQAFQCGEFIERMKAATPKHMNADRLLRTFVQATGKQPLLLQCDMRSVLGQMLTCSALGLEINTPLGHAYLIPFKGRKKVGNAWVDNYEAQLVIGYKGMVDLSFRSGQITQVDADVVCQGDKFAWEKGSHHSMRYQQLVAKATGTPTHAYATANTKIGGMPFEVMLWDDVLAIRNSSKGYQAAIYAKEEAEKKGYALPRGYTDAPWVKHVIPMASKTAFNQLSKWIPTSPELSAAIVLDQGGDRGGVHYGTVIDETGNILDAAMDGVDFDADPPDAAYGDRRPADTGQTQQQQQQTTTTTTDTTQQDRAAADRAAAQKAEKAKLAAEQRALAKRAADVRKPANATQRAEPQADAGGPPAGDEPPPPSDADYYPGGATQSQKQPEQAKPAAPAQDEQPKPAEAQQLPADAVVFYLSDEYGEMVDDGFFDNPVTFAKRFVDEWRKSSNPDALKEGNADPIQDARAASREATTILAEIEQDTPGEADDGTAESESAEDGGNHTEGVGETNPKFWLVHVPQNEQGRPGLAAYVAAVRMSLASVTKPGQIIDWVAINQPTYAPMPRATKMAIEQAIQARKTEIGMPDDAGGEPAADQAQQQPAAGDKPAERDADRERAMDRMADVGACKNEHEIRAVCGMGVFQTLMARFKRDRPDLFKMVDDFVFNKLAELKGK